MKNVKNPLSPGTAASLAGQTNSYNTDPGADQPTDDALVTRCRAGNMDAFTLLIERYQHRLYNAILRIVANHDDAQELTQESFVRAMQGIKKFRGSAGFYTWLFRIGINLSINFRRRRQHIHFTSLQPPDDQLAASQAAGLANLADPNGPSPSHLAELHEMHQRISDALKLLDPTARAIVVLRDIEQLNYNDIAKIMEVPVGTIKSRLFRARNSLKEKLLNES